MNFKLGKQPARHDIRTLKLAHYTTALPAPPVDCNYISKIPTWPMFSNDRLGDCVAAAAGHMIQQWTTYAGTPRTPTGGQVITFYENSGYDPSDPSTDLGWDLLSALRVWRQKGLAWDRIAAYIKLKTGDWDELCQAIYLFGNVYLGMNLPDAVVPSDPHADWSKINWFGNLHPNPGNGHCIPVMAYTTDSNIMANHRTACFVSWGSCMRMDDRFYAACNDEAYAVVTHDWFKQDKAPNGFNLDQLIADLAEVTA